MSTWNEQIALLEHVTPVELRGRVAELRGLAVHVDDLPVPAGAAVRIQTRSPVGSGGSVQHQRTTDNDGTTGVIDAEVVGFDREQTIVMPLGSTAGIGRGDVVAAQQYTPMLRVGQSVLGRVINGMGQPIDRKGPLTNTVWRPLMPPPIDPLDRPLIDQPLATGIRAIDALCSVGRGQRLGVFSPPGVGKSTLMGLMARHTGADVTVIALVGERGREVNQFITEHLGEAGLARSVVVCAAGDEPALLRIRAALVAMTVAEYFRDQGLDVLFFMDSLTRFCHAARQVGLAAGEPPATKGYTPGVFSMLPVLLERSGRTRRGSISGFYAVLVEGDELTDPITDAARGVLDGHIVLNKQLANRGHWPAIDVVESLSRVVDDVTDRPHQAARRQIIQLIDAFDRVEDLLNIGAYLPGSNPEFDLAITCKPAIDQLLQQRRNEKQDSSDWERSKKQLFALIAHTDRSRQELQRSTNQRAQAPAAVATR